MIVRKGLLAAIALGGSAVSAQEPPTTTTAAPTTQGPPIVVTARRETGDEIRAFVEALTAARAGRQLGRFEQRVCPTALGVSTAQKAAVAGRMRRVVKAVGLDVGTPDCLPNVLVILTADKRAFLEALSKRHPAYFGGLSRATVRLLVQDPAPAAAWQIDGPPIDSDGRELDQDLENSFYISRSTRVPTRIRTSTRRQFDAAVVVIESRALAGLTTTQVGDYATLRALSQADPAKLPGSAPTILTILDAPMGSAVPNTLTSWDLGFLRALYSADGNAHATRERAEIRRRLSKDLTARAAGRD